MKTTNQSKSIQLALLVWLLLLVQPALCFYNSQTGRWLTRDPLEERGARNVYALVGNEPVSRNDFLGQIIISSFDPEKLPCGGFNMDWSISLDNPAPDKGYIVQEICVEYDATTCQGIKLHDSFKYWEAFPVAKNANQADIGVSGGGVDYWSYASSSNTKNGHLKMSGRVRFYLEQTTGVIPPGPNLPGLPSNWATGKQYGGTMEGGTVGPPWPMNSGTFPSTDVEPLFWRSLLPIEQGGNRSLTRNWNCCCPLRDPDTLIIQ